jgi:hypothetical protein
VAKPAGVVCRFAAGVCDVAEACDGTSATCPDDAFAPSSTPCRPALDACDLDDFCTGTSAACPAFDLVKSGFDAVLCAFDRAIAPSSCAGQGTARTVARLYERAGKRIGAPASSPRVARAHLCAARRRVARALVLIDRASTRRRRNLSRECAADLSRLVSDALDRIEALGPTCGRR